MNPKILGVVVVLVLIGLGGFMVFGNREHRAEVPQTVTNKEEGEASGGESSSVEGYHGKLIAGSVSPYLAFKQEDYEKAVSERKTIFLDFYANWCPVCRVEAPEIIDGFNALNNENVIGFRVNFNDSETDDDENMLAKDLDIPNQYTKVILIDGQEILRSKGESWDSGKVVEELSGT